MATFVQNAGKVKLIDIAVNLTDCVFRGISWKGKPMHPDDFDQVILRAKNAGVDKIIVSGTSMEVSQKAVELCKQNRGFLYCTVGVHPAHCNELFFPLATQPEASKPKSPTSSTVATPVAMDKEFAKSQLGKLRSLIDGNRDVVVGIGEIGLDYAEEKLCSREVQRHGFELQLEMAKAYQLPLFLHSRDCGMDFVDVIAPFRSNFHRGVVHSFNGSPQELDALLAMKLHIGINGSSLREKETAEAILRVTPLDALVVESDAPWCDIRKDHYAFSFIKTHFESSPKEKFQMGKCVQRRNEPCHCLQVLEALYGIRADVVSQAPAGCVVGPAMSFEEFAAKIYGNTVELFPSVQL